jgi:hypothetical protein
MIFDLKGRRALTPRGALSALILIALLAFAGCGGDDDDGSTATSGGEASITKPQFIAKATRLCNRAKAKMATEFVSFIQKNGTDPKARQEAVETILIPHLRTQIEELGALPVPAGDEEEISNFLSTLEEVTDKIEDEKISGNVELGEALIPAGRIAERYGMNDCAYGF